MSKRPRDGGRLIFVLAGQSNMAGRAPLPPKSDSDTVDGNVRCFHQREDRWVDAADPLHSDKPPPKPGVGPGLPFAREVMTIDDIAASCGVGLVPCACGGSELARWEHGGDLRDEALRRTKLALEQDRTGRLAGILWHQGESDAADTHETTCKERVRAEYRARLESCLASFRTALVGTDGEALPIVLGELGYFLLEHQGVDARFNYSSSINDAIIEAASALPCCEVASAHGLGHRGDRLHFDCAAVEKMGVRYAQAWRSLARGGSARPALPLGFPAAAPRVAPELGCPCACPCVSTSSSTSTASMSSSTVEDQQKQSASHLPEAVID